MISPNEALDPDIESLNLYGPGQGVVSTKRCGFDSEIIAKVEISRDFKSSFYILFHFV